MEIVEEECEGCGDVHKVCGECGGRHITPVDTVDGRITDSIRRTVLDAEDGDEFEVVQVCWDCGAKCVRTVSVGVEHEDPE